MDGVATDLRTGMELDVKKVRPKGARILIRVLPQEKEKGNLLMARTEYSQQDFNVGIPVTVIAVGDKVEIPVKRGDTIFIKPDSGRYIGDGDGMDPETPYRIIEEDEALAVKN